MEQPESATQPRDSFRELFESSADAIFIVENEKITACNAASVEMFRFSSKEEVLGTHPSRLSPRLQPDGRESFEKANEMIGVALANGNNRFEWDHKRADGEVFPVEVLLTAVVLPGRRLLHAVMRDITERKELEDQLRQSQKMEAIGKLTGGIAHDFNNLLVAVLGHSELLSEMLREQPQALEHVTAIRQSGERAAELVRQLLAFGRKQQLLPRVLDLGQVVLDLRTLLERLVAEEVELDLSTPDKPVAVMADRSQIEQVLLNLAVNARDAMPTGGRLRIAVSRIQVTANGGATKGGVAPGDYAQLEVVDSGVGMDAATQAHAFEPFFTTKAPGRGTGLGLATVYGIVKQSGGSVALASTPGQGTSVKILLPLSRSGVAPERADAPEREKARGRQETVLVVEDDQAVFQLVVRGLEASGYRVITARNGLEAELAFERDHARIDLVLTDVIMPNCSGAQLVKNLAARGHEPRVLFMSGYTDEALSSLHALGGTVDVLEKPFNVHELAERVRAALDRR